MADDPNDISMGMTGFNLVSYALTMAGTMLSDMKRRKTLDDRDRFNCERVQRLIEKAECVAYGRTPAHHSPRGTDGTTDRS